MFNHIVMFWWKSGVTAQEVAVVSAGLSSLPDQIAEIRRYEHGSDLGVGTGATNADYVLLSEFDSSESWRIYAEHPAHVAVIETSIKPIVDKIERIQFDVI